MVAAHYYRAFDFSSAAYSYVIVFTKYQLLDKGQNYLIASFI